MWFSELKLGCRLDNNFNSTRVIPMNEEKDLRYINDLFAYIRIQQSKIFDLAPQEYMAGLKCVPFDLGKTILDGQVVDIPMGHLQIGSYKTPATIAYARTAWELDSSAQENIFYYPATYFNLGEFFYEANEDDFYNYNGYTIIKAFLPYYGFVEIPANEVINKYIQFRLHFDIYSCQATYYIGVSEETTNANNSHYCREPQQDSSVRLISMVSCAMSTEYPMWYSNLPDQIRNTFIDTIKFAGSMVTNFSAPTSQLIGKTVTKGVQKTNQVRSTGYTANITKNTLRETERYKINQPVNATSSVIEAASIAINASGAHAQCDKPSSSYLWDGLDGNIHIVIYRPKFVNVNLEEYGHTMGFPCGETLSLNSVYGYSEISKIHLEGFSGATGEELSILESIMLGGVIFPNPPTT